MVQESNASAYRTPVQNTSPLVSGRPRYRGTSHQSTTTRQSNQTGPLPTTNAGLQATATLTNLIQNYGHEPSDAFQNMFMGVPPVDMGAGPGAEDLSPGGGGGGGGGGGVDPAVSAAYKALYDSMKADTSVDDEWNRYIGSLPGLYDPRKAAYKWETATKGVDSASKQGRVRMEGIYNDLVGRAATGRQAVAGAVSQGDQALQNIMARFQGASGAGADNINNVLSNFDAGQMDPNVYANELQNMFAAGQIGNQRMGNAYDVAFADRPQVYAGLNSDIKSGMISQEQAMMNQIAAKRASEAQGLNAQLQQAMGQAGISRTQAAQARNAEIMKLQAELAGMGITI